MVDPKVEKIEHRIKELNAIRGEYRAEVSNAVGSKTSGPATLSLPVKPSITTQPQTQSVGLGDEARFTVAADGTTPLSYQWYFNGTPITWATGSSLTITNATPQSIGQYSVTITNNAGTANSTLAALWISNLKMYAGVNVYGPVGGTCRVDIATSLVEPIQWHAWTNIVLQSSPEVIIDYDSPNSPERFYRTVPTP